MAIAFIRQNTGTASPGATSAAITITAPTDGDCLVLFFGASNSTPVISSISQTGATWVKGKQSNVQASCEIWYALNVSGASTSLTVNTTGLMTAIAWNVAEFSGETASSAADGTGASNSNGSKTTAASTGSFSTSNANDLVLACVLSATATQPSVQPSGYQTLTFVGGVGAGLQANYNIISATGSQSAAWTISKAVFEAEIYALKAASGTQFTQSLTAATVAMAGSIVRGRLIGAATVASVADIAKRLLRSLTAS